MNGNKFATGQILRKPVEVVKGQILAGWAPKSSEPCSESLHNVQREYELLLFGCTSSDKWKTVHYPDSSPLEIWDV
jgi:hypothetical protein